MSCWDIVKKMKNLGNSVLQKNTLFKTARKALSEEKSKKKKFQSPIYQATEK